MSTQGLRGLFRYLFTGSSNPPEDLTGGDQISKKAAKFRFLFTEPSNPPEDLTGGDQISKKAAKKEAAKLEKQRRRDARFAEEGATSAAMSLSIDDGDDPLAANYGDLPLMDLQSKPVSGRTWTDVGGLIGDLKGQKVWIRGQVQAIRNVSKKMAFLVVRERGSTVQCILNRKEGVVSQKMIAFAVGVGSESIIDVEGVVSIPSMEIKGTSQQVEIQVTKIYLISKATDMPIRVEDCARSEVEIEEALKKGEKFARVNQDTRLNNRVIDLRTPANQAIFYIQCQVENIFRNVMLSKEFVGIHTPKLNGSGGSSEGGSDVFKLDYKGKPACLAQSPQLHKQMAICSGFWRVFEVGSIYRAEDSFTNRHLCEFTGLDVEMDIKEHYGEVMDMVGSLFVTMFDTLNETCKKELEAINRQYPFQPLKYLRETLRLTFAEGVQMLQEAGVNVDPYGDLNTQAERKLGQLVLEKYGTEFYIVHRYPLAVRPFYTMPCYDDPAYSNSFDVFIRGEEIISGSQRIHEPELLTQRAKAMGVDVNDDTMSTYIDSFRYGAPPHGGFGVGLERVVMLFCALNNIRKTSLYPRDPTRISP